MKKRKSRQNRKGSRKQAACAAAKKVKSIKAELVSLFKLRSPSHGQLARRNQLRNDLKITYMEWKKHSSKPWHREEYWSRKGEEELARFFAKLETEGAPPPQTSSELHKKVKRQASVRFAINRTRQPCRTRRTPPRRREEFSKLEGLLCPWCNGEGCDLCEGSGRF